MLNYTKNLNSNKKKITLNLNNIPTTLKDQIYSSTPNPKINESIKCVDESSFEDEPVIIDNLLYECTKIENQIEEKSKQMNLIIDTNNKLKQDCFLVEKEQELFSQELSVIKEKIKDINWKINKDFCNKFLSKCNIDKCPSIVVNLCEIFLNTVNLKDTSWTTFKELINNFSKFKHLMSTYSEENLNDEQITKLMDLWKSYDNLDMKLQQKFPEAQLILKWLILIIELKIKSRSLLNSKEKLVSLSKEIDKNNNNLKGLDSQIILLKLNWKKKKLILEKAKSLKEAKKEEIIKKTNPEVNNFRKEFKYNEPEVKFINRVYSTNPISLSNFNKNVVKISRSYRKNDVTINNESTFDYNQSIELDEKTPIVVNKLKLEENLNRKTKNDFIVNAIKEIKLDPPTYDKGRKPMPNKEVQTSSKKRRAYTNDKKVINDLPSFKTKNNQIVLSDNSSSMQTVNTLSDSNSQSKISKHARKNSIEIFSINTSNNNLNNEDNFSVSSKNLFFSPRNIVTRKPVICHYEDLKMQNYERKIAFSPDKIKLSKSSNLQGVYSCKNFSNLFC